MGIFQWFLQTNASELALNLAASVKASDFLLLAYLALSLLIKRAVYLAAFFMSSLLFEASVFDALTESQLYLLTFAIYSYVVFVIPCNVKAWAACVILIALSIILAYDAYFYGEHGVYGARETVIYNNIEYLALYSHILFICSLIPYRRIKDSIRRFFNSIMLMSRNSACFLFM